jgi:HTH-type transcriptional regulator/antitoxin HigA
MVGIDMRPARVPSPGRIIRRELEERGWSQNDLAEIMGRPPQTISQIVRGRKQITPETALQLAAAFGTSEELWINLETRYQLHRKRQESNQTEITRKSKLYSKAPITELLKRHWIGAVSSIDELERRVCAFLEIGSLGETPAFYANLRQAAIHEPEMVALISWIQRVKHLTSEQNVADFDVELAKSELPSLLSLASKEEYIVEVPSFLKSVGIHFVIVPHLPHSYLDGASLLFNDHPVVALTLRYNRIDSFWFTLLHEIAHVLAKHPAKMYLDNHDEQDKNKIESQANQMAHDWLIDPSLLSNFVRSTKPYFSRAKILNFAQQINRHPGLVLGRLQHEQLVPYKNLRTLLVKVQPYLEEWFDSPGSNNNH